MFYLVPLPIHFDSVFFALVHALCLDIRHSVCSFKTLLFQCPSASRLNIFSCYQVLREICNRIPVVLMRIWAFIPFDHTRANEEIAGPHLNHQVLCLGGIQDDNVVIL